MEREDVRFYYLCIMKRYKYTENYLTEKVKRVKSYRQLIISVGAKYPSGGLHVHLKKLIHEYGIDTTHFHGQGWNKGSFVKPPHTKESFEKEVLCLNGKGWKGGEIKKKLIIFGFKKEVCESCLNTAWLGLPIPLELHHENGNKNDNRLENLKLICPNCHAMTDNYRGKNK